MQQTTERAIAEWLTRDHPMPEQVWTEWATMGVALVPLGKRFAAVRMTAEVVHAAVDSDDPAQVASGLEELLRGPVVHDRRVAGVTYYALVQCDAGFAWGHNEVAPRLGAGVYLGVPRIGRCEPPGTYWVVAPRHEGHLCSPQAVADLIDAGQQRIIQGAEL
ncbi:hypothetical protein ACFVYF_26370 [Streptomyces sp. NPDC058274]|uniref:hypothetical protein n=1 Tax=Streptomyces sp. NPDC058274 TaxID=3346416 RepID=UPI0036E242B0